MNINLLSFNVSIGKKKPRTIKGYKPADSACPFCAVDKLVDIIDTDGSIILLKNKYQVIENSYQLVLIENDVCHSDIPDYTPEHLYKLMHFALSHWVDMVNSGKYEVTILFKNFGPFSGGTITHPHMQIVGFPEIQPELMFDPAEFAGITAFSSDGIEVNMATRPHVAFTEINIIATEAAYPAGTNFIKGYQQHQPGHKIILPETRSINTMADMIQQTITFLQEIHPSPSFSYNLFFYLYDGRIHLKVMPRFPTSPLFIGYNIHFTSTNIQDLATRLTTHLTTHI
ncbi:MAG: DUF4931 domain-containing protein [Selenomonadaceae bacterium]|nr:DUF4931 domain-containing protein [Selenomonadaceae bacterium]